MRVWSGGVGIKRKLKKGFGLILGAVLFLLTISPYCTLFLMPAELRYALMKEDGAFETAAAACWLLCAVIFFFLYIADRSGNDFMLFKTRRNIFLLLLAGLFFAGFGEEISWGQRIFGLQTPDPLKEINEQCELNIHNLAGFQVERLFSLFWFTYAFAVPLTIKISRRSAAVAAQMNWPAVPLGIGILFPVNYFVSKFFEPAFTGNEENLPIEAKEFVFALLFLAAGLSFLRTYRNTACPLKEVP